MYEFCRQIEEVDGRIKTCEINRKNNGQNRYGDDADAEETRRWKETKMQKRRVRLGSLYKESGNR